MATYKLDEDVCLMILLHAAKYPSCTVNGLLLGTRTNKSIHLKAAVPLFHTVSLTLAPCVETALGQVEQLAKQQDMQLLGYYHSEARFDSTDLPPIGKRISDRLADRQPGACAVLLENQQLGVFVEEGSSSPFELFLREGTNASTRGVWKRAASDGSYRLELAGAVGGEAGWRALQARFLNVHTAGLHHRVVDFDEHLDDLSRDYTNAGLLGPETRLLAK